MNEATRERLFGFTGAFEHPVTVGITIAVASMLMVATVVIWVLQKSGR